MSDDVKTRFYKIYQLDKTIKLNIVEWPGNAEQNNQEFHATNINQPISRQASKPEASNPYSYCSTGINLLPHTSSN
jgi:hypothetical protein